MAQLPLSVRVKIRDLWEPKNSRMRQLLKEIEELLGPRISLECRWPLLYSELKGDFADVEVLVPSVVDLVEKWCRTFISSLEAEPPPPWMDDMVESAQKAGKIKVMVEAIESKVAGMRWEKSTCTFVLQMPGAPPRSSPYAASFESAFHNLAPSDDFVNVQSDNRAERPGPVLISDTLPSLDSLDRPEKLFPSLPVKIISVNRSHNGFVVASTHENSLKLIQSYFEKWMRPLEYNSSGRYKIQLEQSDFGKGLYFDKLNFEMSTAYLSQRPAPEITLLLAFVEGVLGYSIVPELSTSSQFYFRRTTPLE